MKKLLQFIIKAITLILVVIINLGASYILPKPYSQINVVLGLLLLYLFWRGTGAVVWLSFFAHLLTELYALSQFGIILFSGTISMLFAYWSYKSIFTNKSWYAVLLMTIFTVTLYRLMYTFLLLSSSVINKNFNVLSLGQIGTTYIWELVFTTFFVTAVYALSYRISKST